jgi:hypothetical protein
VWSRHFSNKTFIFFIIIPPGNPRSTGQEEKMKLFLFDFFEGLFYYWVSWFWLKEVSTTHIHTDIPKCVRGPPEEGGCLLKKASPLLFSSFPIHSTTTSTLHN